MVRLIQKSGIIQSNGAGGYMRYIATRDGVEKVQGRDGYMNYIATRPGVERQGEHGLFSNSTSVDLPAAVKELEAHSGNVWTLIYSLRREDAARLGYDNAESWRQLLLSHQAELAEAMKIPPDQLRWYAAFHDESSHPHIHMMVWSADPKRGYLTRSGIKTMRSILTNDIFQDELYALYQEKYLSYNDVTAAAREAMSTIISRMELSSLQSLSIEAKMQQLAQELKSVPGKKVYGYLNKPLKTLVDAIVDELATIPEVAAYYAVWNQLRDELEAYYRDTPRQHLPLSQQKEFRAIKNMIIQEAMGLQPDLTTADPSISETPIPIVTKLLHHMSRIFRETPPPSNPVGIRIDSKRRKKLMEKRMAMGHKPDDHEDQSQSNPNMNL